MVWMNFVFETSYNQKISETKKKSKRLAKLL